MRKSSAFLCIAALLLIALLVPGCGRRDVPNVVGMGQADAVRALEEAGYRLGEVTLVATDTVALGKIAAQKPAAGERARKDSAVALAVSFSDGKKVLIPTVTGMSLTTAQGIADTMQLTAVVVDQYSDEVPADEVAAQVPEPGSEVAVGATLVMVVSKGAAPEKAKVPDVGGDSQSDAEAALTAAGFPSTVYKVYNSDVGKGKVITQLPEAGSSQRVGSEVELVVSLGKGTGAVKVPSVTGKKDADAVDALESAGFEPKKLSEYNADVDKGKVIAQFPDSGSTAAKGSEVIYVVSLGAEPDTAVTVPDVTGMPVEEAESALDDAGFSVTVEEAASGSGSDAVLYQFPEAEAEAAPGSDVLIVVGLVP